MAQSKIIKRKIKKYQVTLKRVAKKVAAKKSKPVSRAVGKKTIKKTIIKEKIRPNMIISDVMEKYPEVMKVFFEYGITCVGCFLASEETVEQGISAHGLDVKKFLKDLNEALK